MFGGVFEGFIMGKNEANKIIAEYMGLGIDVTNGDVIEFIDPMNGLHGRLEKFSNSLDALVPVWDKLSPYYGVEHWRDAGLYSCKISHLTTGYSISHRKESVQEAATVATAKAILELSND